MAVISTIKPVKPAFTPAAILRLDILPALEVRAELIGREAGNTFLPRFVRLLDADISGCFGKATAGSVAGALFWAASQYGAGNRSNDQIKAAFPAYAGQAIAALLVGERDSSRATVSAMAQAMAKAILANGKPQAAPVEKPDPIQGSNLTESPIVVATVATLDAEAQKAAAIKAMDDHWHAKRATITERIMRTRELREESEHAAAHAAKAKADNAAAELARLKAEAVAGSWALFLDLAETLEGAGTLKDAMAILGYKLSKAKAKKTA